MLIELILLGKAINMTSDDISINSNNFNVDKYGNMNCSNATIRGKVIVGGDQENPEFIATDGDFTTTVFPLGLLNEVDGEYATVMKGGFGCGFYTSSSMNETTSIDVYGIRTNSLTVYGSKNRAVKIDNEDFVLLNAYETTTPYFGDIGSNKTDENGYCKIDIEEIFSQTIELENYKVFIQECGDGHLYVKKYNKFFEVYGTSNLNFDWEIKAIQKGYKNTRLEKFENKEGGR